MKSKQLLNITLLKAHQLKHMKIGLYSLNRKSFGGHHDHDHHHEITGEVNLERKPVTQARDLSGKFISLRGLDCDHPVSYVEAKRYGLNKYDATKDPIDIFENKLHTNEIEDEDNPYLHEEAYGYLSGTDVRFILIM